MARRPKETGEAISLFPFLSILACVIGILTLMITTLALSQVTEPEVDAADEAARQQAIAEARQRAEEYKQLKQEVDFKIIDQKRLEKLLEEAQKRQAELEKLKKESQTLARRIEEAKDSAAVMSKISAELGSLVKRIEQLQMELTDLTAEIDKLKKELAERKKPPEEAAVIIEPGGSGTNLKPTFVEAGRDGIVIYPDEGDGEGVRVRSADLAASVEYRQLLERLAAAKDQSIVFLVREDGVGTYYRARDIARNAYVRNGKLPVMGQGRIDLTMFRKLIKK
jgi:chaperonin cofactor prefoldin